MSAYRGFDCPQCADMRSQVSKLKRERDEAEDRGAHLRSGVATVVDSMRRDLERDRASLMGIKAPWLVACALVWSVAIASLARFFQ